VPARSMSSCDPFPSPESGRGGPTTSTERTTARGPRPRGRRRRLPRRRRRPLHPPRGAVPSGGEARPRRSSTAVRLRAQPGEEERVRVAQLHAGDRRPRARPQLVHHRLHLGTRLRRRTHDRLPVALAAEVRLDALGPRLEAVARRPSVAHEPTDLRDELRGQRRAPCLEAHQGAGRDPKDEVHEAPAGVVGLAELHRARPARRALAHPLRASSACSFGRPGPGAGPQVDGRL
jgi:hypothetical protein